MPKNDRLTRLLLELPWLIQNRNASIDSFSDQFDISRDEAIKDLSLLTYVGPGRFGGELVDIQYDDEFVSVIDSQGFDRPLKLNNIEAVLLLLGVKNLGEISNDISEINNV
jgi:proteasome accessory factor C